MNLPHIPFHTLAQRHLVFAYGAVWLLQFGYGIWLAIQWHKSRTYASLDPQSPE